MASWLNMRLVGLDTETTGLLVTEDRIFEIGLVTFQDGQVVERWEQLLDPLKPLSEESVQKTGISDADLKGKPVFATIAAEVAGRLEGRVVVGYNLLSFDLPLLENELARVGLKMPQCWPVDVLIFARELVKTGRHNLGEMARHFDVPMETAHRAIADAEACVRILLAMAQRLPQDLEELVRLQAQWLNEQRARRVMWRQKQSDSLLKSVPGAELVDEQGRVTLGPGYIYGQETDPLRAFLAAYMASGNGT